MYHRMNLVCMIITMEHLWLLHMLQVLWQQWAGHARPLQAVQTLPQKKFKRPRPCHNSDTTGWYDGENGTGKETKP